MSKKVWVKSFKASLVLILMMGTSARSPSSDIGYIFLVDISGSMKSILSNVKKAAADFLDDLQDSTQVHLATFHESGEATLSTLLTDSTRLRMRETLLSLRPSGQWTHFTAAVEALQSIKTDSSQVYTVIIFTDELGDPRPGFQDISIDEISSSLPENFHFYIISTPQALSSLGVPDSTGIIATSHRATGVVTDMKSSENILDRIRAIATSKKITDIIRPKPILSKRIMALLLLVGLIMILMPVLYQTIRKKNLHLLVNAQPWTITAIDDSKYLQDFRIYPGQRLTIGSEGIIEVACLPPIALELHCRGYKLRLYPHSEVLLNGQNASGSTYLADGDEMLIDHQIQLKIQHREIRDDGS